MLHQAREGHGAVERQRKSASFSADLPRQTRESTGPGQGVRPSRRCAVGGNCVRCVLGFGRRPVLSLLARLASDLLVPDSPDLLLARAKEEKTPRAATPRRGEENTERQHKVSDEWCILFVVCAISLLPSDSSLPAPPSGGSSRPCARGFTPRTKNDMQVRRRQATAEWPP